MKLIPVYAPAVSSRLVYILDWLFKDVLKRDYILIHEESALTDFPFFISYGKSFDRAVSIPDAGLLYQTGTHQHQVPTGTWEDLPVIYASLKPGFSIPFDLLSALFFLITRYEEYYPFTPDRHNRYPPDESLLSKNGWLQRPLADEWIHAFIQLLSRRSVDIPATSFSFLPTYDIDIAYSYKYKGLGRTLGSVMQHLLSGNIGRIRQRLSVLSKKQRDPYDSFSWLEQQHAQRRIKPIYFILAALSTTAFDKNISPRKEQMKELLHRLKKDGTLALHPSYYSGKESVFRQEKNILETITLAPIKVSRQHYIKFSFPETFQLLLQRGISDEYSMGYGGRLGFRAGTGRPFYWYDLKYETTTALRIHPFAFMDTTAHFEEGLDPDAAFEKLECMAGILMKTGSRLITIFHNFSLGTDPEWKGWSTHYEVFLKTKAPYIHG